MIAIDKLKPTYHLDASLLLQISTSHVRFSSMLIDWLAMRGKKVIITNEYIWLYYWLPLLSSSQFCGSIRSSFFFFFRLFFFCHWIPTSSFKIICSLCSIYWDGWIDACWFILSSSYLFTSLPVLTSPLLILNN